MKIFVSETLILNKFNIYTLFHNIGKLSESNKIKTIKYKDTYFIKTFERYLFLLKSLY